MEFAGVHHHAAFNQVNEIVGMNTRQRPATRLLLFAASAGQQDADG
jgi:hypothetical protein